MCNLNSVFFITQFSNTMKTRVPSSSCIFPDDTPHFQSSRGSVTSSTLLLLPSAEDSGETLRCEAYSPAAPETVLHDSLQLLVNCEIFRSGRSCHDDCFRHSRAGRCDTRIRWQSRDKLTLEEINRDLVWFIDDIQTTSCTIFSTRKLEFHSTELKTHFCLKMIHAD